MSLPLARTLTIAVVLVALLALATPAAAHSTTAAPVNGTADEWTAWMYAHMTGHMGPGAIEWMESHMGLTIEEMEQHMADNQRMTRGAHC